MKKKIVGILFCMMLIATAIQAIGSKDIGNDQVDKGNIPFTNYDCYIEAEDRMGGVGFITRNWVFRGWDDENDFSISSFDKINSGLEKEVWGKESWNIESFNCEGDASFNSRNWQFGDWDDVNDCGFSCYDIIDDLENEGWDNISWIIDIIDCIGNTGNMQKLPGIDFYQVNYNWEKSSYENSNTGEIVVNIDKVKKATGLESGYINAYSDQGWIIQNLAFLKCFPYPCVSSFFNLGQTGEVKSINVFIEVSSEPVSYFEYSGAYPTYPVSDITYDAEGGNESVEIMRPQPPPADVPGGGDFADPSQTFSYHQNNHPNVPCAKNQCVPVAYANNLQYLENEFGTSVSHDLVCGVNGSPPNSLPAVFDVYMQRKVVDEYKGNATSYSKALSGFVKYTYFESLPISLKHQGIKGNDDVTFQDVTSYGQGKSISIDFIIDEMKKGHAVALAFNWYHGEKSVGGHMVQLVAAGKILGVPFIQYLDDIPQGYCAAGNKITQTYLRDWDFDGKINLLNAPWWAWTINGPAEITQLVVMTSDNQPPLKPSMPSGGEFIMETDIVYGFSTSTTDPNGDQIWYLFDWGDGTNSGWIGPKDSGETASAFKLWDTAGFYKIKAKARDFYDAESEWSDERLGILQKVTPHIKIPLLLFLEQHPYLSPIPIHLFGLQN